MVVNLPKINGEFEAGIAAGNDTGIPDGAALPILAGAGHARCATNAAIWACEELPRIFGFNSDMFRKWAAVLAYAEVAFGLCRRVSSPESSNFDNAAYMTTNAQANELPPDVREFMTSENLRVALTAIIATKCNFWSINHHTGQGYLQGYAKKVYSTFFAPLLVAESDAIALMHTAGHWASTRHVLSLAGIHGIITTYPVDPHWDTSFTIGEDAMVRFQSNPAGTAKLEVAYQAAKRLFRHAVAPLCPSLMDFAILPDQRNSMMENRARYHIGAVYLTGEPRLGTDSDVLLMMGRLASFISVFYAHSTLSKPNVIGCWL